MTPVDVLVPVLRRPAAAAPFMASLTASGAGPVTVTAIADTPDDDETAGAWAAAGATVLRWPTPPRGTFARKVNAAYSATGDGPDPAPWVLLVGDDVRFEPGWLQHLLAATVDDPNALVLFADNGITAKGAAPDTHPFVARRYVDMVGGTWDAGPGTLTHVGYLHNYVDAELSQVAYQRGVRRFVPAARITHLHHLAGTAPVDKVYELGTRDLARDRKHYLRRLRRYFPEAAAQVNVANVATA